MSLSFVFGGDDEEALALRSELVELGERLGAWSTIAFIESGIAMAYAMRDLDRADAQLERAADAARRSGNPSAKAFAALARARILGYRGRLEDARPFFAEARNEYLEIGDRRFDLGVRSELAHALRRAGLLDEAEALYRETIHEWVHTGNRGAIANQLEGFASIAVNRGSVDRGATLIGAAEVLREASGAGMLWIERREFDPLVARLRAERDVRSLERAWGEGRAMSVDDAVAFALAAGSGGSGGSGGAGGAGGSGG